MPCYISCWPMRNTNFLFNHEMQCHLSLAVKMFKRIFFFNEVKCLLLFGLVIKAHIKVLLLTNWNLIWTLLILYYHSPNYSNKKTSWAERSHTLDFLCDFLWISPNISPGYNKRFHFEYFEFVFHSRSSSFDALETLVWSS